MTTHKKIVLASGNKGKIKEIQAILPNYNLLPQSHFNIEEVEETGSTFIENAIIKARHASVQSGLPSIADDSGLIVDALQGAPGVISARYAGIDSSDTDNLNKLLYELKEIPKEKRTARFVCIIVSMRYANDPLPVISQGVWEGLILPKPIGENGFGYDPIFWIPNEKKSSAELSSVIKNKLSHRGIALNKFRQTIYSLDSK